MRSADAIELHDQAGKLMDAMDALGERLPENLSVHSSNARLNLERIQQGLVPVIGESVLNERELP